MIGSFKIRKNGKHWWVFQTYASGKLLHVAYESYQPAVEHGEILVSQGWTEEKDLPVIG